MHKISESELVLMKIIWKNGGKALFSDIMQELEKDRYAWKKNTVLTLLARLMEKEFLRADKIGRRNEYIALISQQEYQDVQTHCFVNKIFGGNVKNLVASLLQQDILSADELHEIERFWAGKDD